MPSLLPLLAIGSLPHPCATTQFGAFLKIPAGHTLPPPSLMGAECQCGSPSHEPLAVVLESVLCQSLAAAPPERPGHGTGLNAGQDEQVHGAGMLPGTRYGAPMACPAFSLNNPSKRVYSATLPLNIE
jgi:hypothetical protein